MNEKTQTVSRQDATYVAPIVPEFANVKDAFLANAYKPYFKALQAAADTHQLVQVPIPETFRIENGTPTVDYVTIDVRGTGSPMQNLNPEFALLTLGSNAGLKLIDRATGMVYDVLGKTGRTITKSILTGEASNQVSTALTGKTYGQHLRDAASLVVPNVISKNTPEVVKNYVSEGLNPFYFGSGQNNHFLQQLIRDTTEPHTTSITPIAGLLQQLNFRKPQNVLLNQFGGDYTSGSGDIIHTRAQSLKALDFLKQIYASPLYRERVAKAYPLWSDEKINAFIANQIARTQLAIKKLSYNKSSAELGKTGKTVIQHTATSAEPTSIEVAYDVDDPFLVALHEGLHFSSLGGRAPEGLYQNPDALSIAIFNNKILPTLRRSQYKKYIENPDPIKAKEDYINYIRTKVPYLTSDEAERMFYERILKEGPYYNADDEIRSFGLAELLQGYYKGEIKNPNDPREVYIWLKNKYEGKTMSKGLRYMVEGFRDELAEWAKYLAKALSVGSIPLIQNNKENERLGSTKMD